MKKKKSSLSSKIAYLFPCCVVAYFRYFCTVSVHGRIQKTKQKKKKNLWTLRPFSVVRFIAMASASGVISRRVVNTAVVAPRKCLAILP